MHPTAPIRPISMRNNGKPCCPSLMESRYELSFLFQRQTFIQENLSMASLYKEQTPKGKNYRIQFTDKKRRCSVRLGNVPKKVAETILSRVEEIISCRLACVSYTPETSAWLGKIPDELHDKLSDVGLVEPRQTTEIDTFIRYYIGRRQDVKPGTRLRWNADRKKLIQFFGESRRADTVTTLDAERYKQHLFERFRSRSTISKALCNAKMYFRAMQEENLVRFNPFEKMFVKPTVDEKRNVYVSPQTVYDAMAAAPDVEWSLIITLSRFAGLRCPSEILLLRWKDVRWESNEIVVTSPKTEHHEGGASRVIPLFKELREPLKEAWESYGDEGNGYVIARHRSQADNIELLRKSGWSCCNLGKPFVDILRKAGIPAWAKPFHAMRASCETDLINAGYDIKDVADWMGHSPEVAVKHYLRHRKESFDRAVKYGTTTQGISKDSDN